MNSKKILFLSALDFKEKSIQVIKNTPAFYAQRNWEVDYIVARDNNPKGNYFYESEINPEGLNIVRFYWPLQKVRANAPRILALLLSKIASLIVVFKLALYGFKNIRKGKYDVIYGYELQGVLAMNLLRLFGFTRGIKKVSRFQGTFLNEMFQRKSYSRLFFNLDLILAIRLSSDLLIMTDDGTQGNLAVKKIRKSFKNCFFWVNGVDIIVDDEGNAERESLIEKYNLENQTIFLSVSRLVGWKKVERGIQILHRLKEKTDIQFKYVIVGDGDRKEALEKLVNDLGMTENVVFVGAIKNHLVKEFLLISDFFISMYDSSNVGNPLLEAIRANKLIVTLNNGDTAAWIKHKKNGLIYDLNEGLFDKAATDIARICKDKVCYEQMLNEVRLLEKEKLYTWEQRLNMEVENVSSLLK